jgi:hypothetical protein
VSAVRWLPIGRSRWQIEWEGFQNSALCYIKNKSVGKLPHLGLGILTSLNCKKLESRVDMWPIWNCFLHVRRTPPDVILEINSNLNAQRIDHLHKTIELKSIFCLAILEADRLKSVPPEHLGFREFLYSSTATSGELSTATAYRPELSDCMEATKTTFPVPIIEKGQLAEAIACG